MATTTQSFVDAISTLAGNDTDDGPVKYQDPPLEVPGLVCTLIFYALILATGLLVSWRKGSLKSNDMADVMLAGRDLNMFVGVFTLTATAVGGGYINGTAEVIFTPGWGLIWLQAPIGYSISIACGGYFFGGKMRAKGYFTMLDPFEERYGRIVAGINYLPAVLGEIFWNSAILAALGTSLQVILGVGRVWSVIISALIAYFYTLVGGLYSVAYTDVIQIILVNFGLWLGFGFAANNEHVRPITETSHMLPDPAGGNGTVTGWIGKLENDHWVGSWVDSACLVLLGGLPWQDLFQRVLAARTPRQGQWLGVIGGLCCIIPAIPALLIGAVAVSADWSKTEYVKYGPTPPTDYSMAIPLVLQYLCPKPVAVIGLGALAAAVMSSADSSALSASSMFAKNVYKPIRDAAFSSKPASGAEIIWVMRFCIIVVGVISTVVALTVHTIYGLFILCADLVFVILFPQLLCVVHMEFTNTYGSLFGFAMSTFFRLAGGEPLFNMRPCIWYPWAEEIGDMVYQKFPFKTLSMFIGITSIVLMSLLTNFLFKRGILPARWDVFRCVVNRDPKDYENGRSPATHPSAFYQPQPDYKPPPRNNEAVTDFENKF